MHLLFWYLFTHPSLLIEAVINTVDTPGNSDHWNLVLPQLRDSLYRLWRAICMNVDESNSSNNVPIEECWRKMSP